MISIFYCVLQAYLIICLPKSMLYCYFWVPTPVISMHFLYSYAKSLSKIKVFQNEPLGNSRQSHSQVSESTAFSRYCEILAFGVTHNIVRIVIDLLGVPRQGAFRSRVGSGRGWLTSTSYGRFPPTIFGQLLLRVCSHAAAEFQMRVGWHFRRPSSSEHCFCKVFSWFRRKSYRFCWFWKPPSLENTKFL